MRTALSTHQRVGTTRIRWTTGLSIVIIGYTLAIQLSNDRPLKRKWYGRLALKKSRARRPCHASSALLTFLAEDLGKHVAGFGIGRIAIEGNDGYGSAIRWRINGSRKFADFVNEISRCRND